MISNYNTCNLVLKVRFGPTVAKVWADKIQTGQDTIFSCSHIANIRKQRRKQGAIGHKKVQKAKPSNVMTLVVFRWFAIVPNAASTSECV